MRTFGSFLASMLLLVPVGCGGGGAKGPDGGIGTSNDDGGATPGSDGIDTVTTPVVDGGSLAACNFPVCMAGADACLPSGLCVKQTTATGQATCYDNGVKVVQSSTVVDASAALTYTLMNGPATCFSMSIDSAGLAGVATGAPITLPVQSPTGAIIAVLSINLATGQTSVACTGAAPIALDPACSAALMGLVSTSSCTTGSCQ